MSVEQLRHLGVFALLLAVQVTVCNNIHLFSCATPMVYVMLVLRFRRGMPRWGVLLWCFAMGLCSDIFANTPGVAAASMTAVGLVQPYLLELFLNRDSAEDLQPGLRTLGTAYYWYSFMLIFTFCVLFFTIETFSFFNWQHWLMCIIGSTLLTFVICMAIASVSKQQR